MLGPATFKVKDFGQTGETGEPTSTGGRSSHGEIGGLEVHEVVVVGGKAPQHRDRLGWIVAQPRDSCFAG